MRLLGQITRHPSARILTVWALVFVQAEFLWVGEFHHHEAPSAQHGQTASYRDGNPESSDTTRRPSCIACQIGHERAASPVMGRAPAAPVAVERCLHAADPQFLHTITLAVPSPRAPPVL